jgi:hypothetical protein
MERTPARSRVALTAASLGLVMLVLFASAVIRLAGEELGGTLAVVRGVHRVAASAAALAILAAGWLAWRAGARAMGAGLVGLMLGLSALGAATGISPPPAAAAGNLLGGLLLAALLAWCLGRERRRGGAPLMHAVAALAGLQAALGAWCSIVETQTWTFALIGHATLGLALAGVLAWQAERARERAVLALALAAPLAGLVSGLLDAPAGPALAHAMAAALLVVAAAYAHARLT